MVQQALSYLFNDYSPVGTANAVGDVNEALAADDQDGVDVADVQRAKIALTAGDTAADRRLLQGSFPEAVGALKPAVGEETGTTIMVPPFTQGALAVTDWIFLLLSVPIALAAPSSHCFSDRERECGSCAATSSELSLNPPVGLGR